jgi:large subunit ribosomal protein L22e
MNVNVFYPILSIIFGVLMPFPPLSPPPPRFTQPLQEKFLHDRIKVNGKTGVLGNDVIIVRDGGIITVDSKVPLKKAYLKYLTKKFIKKQEISDYVRVVSTAKLTYSIKFFDNVQADDEEEEE